MAAPDEAVGKAMVKLPALDDLFEPKSIAATVLFAVAESL